ncbi:MAG: hypothetical protein ABI377_05030, partial [Devosia sp.]
MQATTAPHVSDIAPAATGRLSVTARVLVALVVAAAFAWQLSQPLNGDVSWLMTASERMLAGQLLYSDILETNPPMSTLLYLPWVWFGQVTGIAAEGIVVAATLALAGVVLWIADRILASAHLLERRGDWWFVGALVLMLLPGQDFAEREHFALLATVPMLAAFAVRQAKVTPPLWARLAAGIGGGLAMAIKPHFALAILVPAVWVAIATRSLRPIFCLETVIAGMVLLIFWGIVGLAFPAFFTDLLPLGGIIYAGDRLPWLPLLTGRPTWPFWAVVIAMLLLYRSELVRPLPATLFAGAMGFFLAYLAQGKGFSYHLLPATALATAVFLMAFASRNAGGRGLAAAVPKLVAVALVALPMMTAPTDAGNATLVELLRPLGPKLKIANITPQLGTTSPLVRELGATLVNSGPFMWMALGAIRIENSGPSPALMAMARTVEQHERDRLRQDLLR